MSNYPRLRSPNYYVATLGTALLFSGIPAHALTWNASRPAFFPLEDFDRRNEQLLLHSFQSDAVNNAQGFNLFQSGHMRFDQAVTKLLRDRLVNPMIEIRVKNSTPSFGLRQGSESQDFRFFVNGIPVCDYQVRAHRIGSGDRLILGSAPDVDVTSPIPESDWPNLNASYRLAVAEMQRTEAITGRGPTQLSDASRCLRAANGELKAVWSIMVSVSGYPYKVIADATAAYSIKPLFFDATGTAEVFPNNVEDSAMMTFELPNLKGDGSLTSSKFTTYVADDSPRAYNANHVFNYGVTDPEYAEVSAFVHAQTHLKFFESLGFEWYGPKPLQIRVHERPNGETNNALFMPSSQQRAVPTIFIGDGDGDVLKNLGTDADVISHELGHFIVFQTLTETTGESLVLHEGLADFFTFARTGNACLGESICPAGDGSACWSETIHECLRTGETSLTYKSSDWERLKHPRTGAMGHWHGQAISGLLWDMRQKNQIPAEAVTKLVFGALSYLGDASGFTDFLLSLLLADRDLYQSKYFDQIKSAADARGFGFLIAEVKKPENGIPLPTGTASSLQGQTQVTAKKKSSNSSSNPFKCGVIAATTPFASQLVLALLFFSLPLIIARRQPAKAPVVATRAKRIRRPKSKS